MLREHFITFLFWFILNRKNFHFLSGYLPNKYFLKMLRESDENFDPKKPLPPHKRIESAGSHLYLIGLSRFPFGSIKRNKFNYPLFSLILHILFFIRSILLIILPEHKVKKFALISGDYSDFFKVRKHFNIGLSTFLSLAIVNQLIHLWTYRKNIYPIYLKPFAMMSGLISPQSVGIREEFALNKLLIRTKHIFKFNKINAYMIPIFTSIVPVAIVYSTKSVFQMIVFGIPGGLLFCYCIYFTFGYQIWQISYFYLICYYLELKLKQCHNQIKGRINKDNNIEEFVPYAIRSLNSIHEEIIEFNSNFWSKYLLSFVIIFITSLNIIIYVSIFAEMEFYIRILFIYVTIMCAITYLIVINSASSVTRQVNKSYILLNKLQVMCCKRKLSNSHRLTV